MIKGIWADIIVSTYLLVTLLLRIFAEKGLEDHPFLSIGVGVVLLLFLWALIKINFLSPNYFGLLKKSDDIKDDI